MAYKGWEAVDPDEFPESVGAQIRTAQADGEAQAAAFDSRTTRKQARPEQWLQIACIEWAARAIFPEFIVSQEPVLRSPVKIGEFLHHTPNGGGRSKAESGIFKAMGVRAGYPDLSLDLAMFSCAEDRYYPGWRCELKTGTEQLRENQCTWRDRLQLAGYVFEEAYSLEEFINKLMAYLMLGVPQIRLQDA